MELQLGFPALPPEGGEGGVTPGHGRTGLRKRGLRESVPEFLICRSMTCSWLKNASEPSLFLTRGAQLSPIH